MMSTTKIEPHQPRLKSMSQLEGEVVLFGGTFDPIHQGHLELAAKVAAKIGAKTVLFMPAGRNPLKAEAPKASDDHRLMMIELAIKNTPGYFVSDLEILAQGKSYTVDTIGKILSAAPKITRLSFAMGTDQIASLHKWKDPERLFKLAHIVPVMRGGETLDFSNLSAEMRQHIRENCIEMGNKASSTAIRDAIKTGKIESLRDALPEIVYNYIIAQNLYK